MLKYNVPTEVSEEALNEIMNGRVVRGSCAGKRSADGKCHIMLWICEYRKDVESIINKFPIKEADGKGI